MVAYDYCAILIRDVFINTLESAQEAKNLTDGPTCEFRVQASGWEADVVDSLPTHFDYSITKLFVRITANLVFICELGFELGSSWIFYSVLVVMIKSSQVSLWLVVYVVYTSLYWAFFLPHLSEKAMVTILSEIYSCVWYLMLHVIG